MTHSMVVSGAGAAAAGDTTLGNIVLPADGPWKIHHIFGQSVSPTITAAESLLTHGVIRSVSGDVKPNPSPCIFPIIESGSLLGASAPQPICPLSLFPVDWNAEGKASIDMILRQLTANTVAPQNIMGLIFGASIPPGTRPTNYDSVRAQVQAAAETAVGTITIAQGNHRITAICGQMAQDNIITANEELIGWFRLASDDVDLAPSQWPFSNAYGGGLGVLIGNATGMMNVIIPVDIPVPGGARINVTVDLNAAVTNAAEISVTLGYI